MNRYDKELDKIRSEYFDSSTCIMMFDEYGDLYDMIIQDEISYDDFLKIKVEYKKAKEFANKYILTNKILDKVDKELQEIRNNYYKYYLAGVDIDELKSVNRCTLTTLWSCITKYQLASKDKLQKEFDKCIRKVKKGE